MVGRLQKMAASVCLSLPWRSRPQTSIFATELTSRMPLTWLRVSCTTLGPQTAAVSFCSTSQTSNEPLPNTNFYPQQPSKQNDMNFASDHIEFEPFILYCSSRLLPNWSICKCRALRVLRSADVILSEDTRHSGKLLHHYDIKTPLLSYHKFNESQREQAVLKRLQQGEIVALISDAGTPGISDPGTELAKLCVDGDIPVIPIPGPSAVVAALSASGLSTDEFTFVGFLPKHAGSRRERLTMSSNEAATQIFYVPPHKLNQRCVMAREMTKIHEEINLRVKDDKDSCKPVPSYSDTKEKFQFWRGSLGEAKEAFSSHQPKGEITFLIEGKAFSVVETPSESQLENELRELISNGHSLSTIVFASSSMQSDISLYLISTSYSPALNRHCTQLIVEYVMCMQAVKLVAAGTSMRRKMIYSLALRKFGNQVEADEDVN
ncbi:hypothetical protein RJ640_020896 [Escallonia rubra]|uniref:Tetrapyrrole methylase domain-containing protein n=1 Tax=Escallonia rubra TaxID=112253 RepID=A0AA88U5M3_9ASTE|nr:hypothetical protein RJ640_020896 [Escallonia rubra]